MTTYTVNIDRNESSENIGTFNTIEEAKKVAIENLEETNPENDSEGINIYTKEGMIMSLSKGSDITLINPITSMPIGTEKIA